MPFKYNLFFSLFIALTLVCTAAFSDDVLTDFEKAEAEREARIGQSHVKSDATGTEVDTAAAKARVAVDTAAAEARTDQDTAVAQAHVAEDTRAAEAATKKEARGTVRDTAAVERAVEADSAAAKSRLKK